jgi:hypothetical protein
VSSGNTSRSVRNSPQARSARRDDAARVARDVAHEQVQLPEGDA